MRAHRDSSTCGALFLRLCLYAVLAFAGMAVPAVAGDPYTQLPKTVERVKASVVAVGTIQVTRRPPAVFKGTGFVVGDGRHVLTNDHVVDQQLDVANKESLAVFIRRGQEIETRLARIVTRDRARDIAVLRIEGAALPRLELFEGAPIPEGTFVVITGFPIGSVLGLYPVTHRGIISAYTPIAIPQLTARQLDPKLIRQLQEEFFVYQLDATAYPGNSGSPIYDPRSGVVYGIVSSVFVKGSKERVLQEPSGISYAIPIRHGLALIP